MTFAWQRAKEVWQQDNAEAFEVLLGRYMAVGALVWSSPEEFFLALPVRVRSDGELRHDDVAGDTWFVHLAALAVSACGRPSAFLERFLARAPYELPWVAWHRRQSKRLHRYRWSTLVARCQSSALTLP